MRYKWIYLLVLYRVIAILACAVLILIIMAAPQPLLVHDLLAQIRAFISATNPPAVLLLNICVDGAGEQKTFRVSVQRDGSLVSLSEREKPSSSFSSSPITIPTAVAEGSTSSSSACSSSSTGPALLQTPRQCSNATAPTAPQKSSSVMTEESNNRASYAGCGRSAPETNSNYDRDVEAEPRERLVLHDDVKQAVSAFPSVHVDGSATETPSSTSSSSNSSSSDNPSIRHSNRTRVSVQRLDCLVAASSQSSPRRRKRPSAIVSTEEDSSEEEAADETATPKRAVRSSSAMQSTTTSSPRTTPRRKKLRGTHASNNRPRSDDTADAEVAILVAKLRSASGRKASTEAVSNAAVLQLGREVLECDGGKEERYANGVVAAASYQRQSAKIAVLISTSTSLRTVGYYLRAVLAARLKATERTTFTEAARRLLGIKSTADVSAYPALWCLERSAKQGKCPAENELDFTHSCSCLHVFP